MFAHFVFNLLSTDIWETLWKQLRLVGVSWLQTVS